MLQKDFNFSDMISALQKEFKGREYDNIATIYEEDPLLPIDLFCSKGEGKEQEWCMVIVASINHISEEFQKKLLFYQYYMSLHYKTLQYKVVLAIPASATIATIPYYAKTEEEKKQDFYKEHGFGLWKISKKRNSKGHETFEISEEPAPMTLRDSQREKFKNCFACRDNYLSPEEKRETSEEVSTQLEKITFNDQTSKYIVRFFDTYIHHSVFGIAHLYPPQFKERHIDPRLLEEILKLKKVPYKGCLFDLITEHLSKKDKNDFDFCTNIVNKLWLKYFNDEIYPEEHKKLEPLLIELYPKYRDHYIHQFQVFLLGALIIDILKCNKKIKSKNGFSPESWLLAASFHDFAYPIQRYDDYISRFFKQSLSIEEPLSFLELKNNYTEYSFASHVEHILCSISKCFNDKDFKGETGTNNFNKIRQFFYYEITKSKNHGLIGSLGLLKKFEDKKDEINFVHILLPAAVAIALHDDEIWQPLHGLETNNGKKEECITCVRKIAPLGKLDFDAYLLAFLLILCDNIQDWGRHYKDEKWEKPLREANIRLKDILFDSGKLIIQLFFNDTWESRKLMTLKKKTLGKIEKLLNSSDIEFVVEYWDREKNGPTSYKFKIGGNH